MCLFCLGYATKGEKNDVVFWICKGEDGFWRIEVFNTMYDDHLDAMKVHYCPMCGRKLEQDQKEEVNRVREIKFRGQQIGNGEWVYGYLRVFDDGSYHITTKVERNVARHIDGKPFYTLYGVEHEVYPETVGQYTGLKDRNGVEIWEGDIVRGHRYSNGFRKEIVGRVMFGFNGWDIAGVGEYVRDTTRLTSFCEVIGNIYDNLELLEVT